MYSWLALQMNIPEKDAHVSKFTRAQCREAIKILRPKYIQLFGRDLMYERKVKSKMRLQVTGSEIFETAHILPKRSENYDGLYSRTYKLRVTVEGPQIGDYNMVIPQEELKEAILNIIPDHKYICYKDDPLSSEIRDVLTKNNVPYLDVPFMPVAENLIKYLKDELDKYLKDELGYNNLEIVEMELSSVDGSYSTKLIK